MPQLDSTFAQLCDAAKKAGFEVLVSLHGDLGSRTLRVDLLDKKAGLLDFERVRTTKRDTPELAAERLLARRERHGL